MNEVPKIQAASFVVLANFLSSSVKMRSRTQLKLFCTKCMSSFVFSSAKPMQLIVKSSRGLHVEIENVGRCMNGASREKAEKYFSKAPSNRSHEGNLSSALLDVRLAMEAG